MESSSQFSGAAEECYSSESGWTMYLESSMHDHGYGDDDDDDDDDFSRGNVVPQTSKGKGSRNRPVKREDEEDESMVSDASSGTPCHKHLHAIRHAELPHLVGKESRRQFSSRRSGRIQEAERGWQKGLQSSHGRQKSGSSFNTRRVQRNGT